MNRTRIIRWLTVAGFGLLAGCGAAQWWAILATGRVEGLSPLFLGLYTAGLALVQAAFRLSRVGLAYEIGNGVGLANAVAICWSWWWVS